MTILEVLNTPLVGKSASELGKMREQLADYLDGPSRAAFANRAELKLNFIDDELLRRSGL